ncbi:hypothetical protein IAI10_06115 [Clostridium sp. 19966]|uniref:hypothetical protein n=1 Tax=Clostridium sp. 19966 TaxID=2768166 RepID=UPI0028DD5911|nr:hypothetical protein [Clostridium sp. 19966]MDT8716225.1 hypothetical protein [Clostridium sp. 19966]
MKKGKKNNNMEQSSSLFRTLTMIAIADALVSIIGVKKFSDEKQGIFCISIYIIVLATYILYREKFAIFHRRLFLYILLVFSIMVAALEVQIVLNYIYPQLWINIKEIFSDILLSILAVSTIGILIYIKKTMVNINK